jgi:hypothetical protein
MKITKKKVVECFSKIVEEYLWNVHESYFSLNKDIPNGEYIVMKGVNLIVHIFKLLIVQTKDLNTVFKMTSHAYHMYLEYILQINQPPILTDLNITDAIQFVLTKTIEFHGTTTTTTTIEPSIKEVLDTLLGQCNTLLEWDNRTLTTENRYQTIKKGELIKCLT